MNRYLVILAAVTCWASASGADQLRRTPSLHWTLDDRLNIGDVSKPGLVVQGDKLDVQIDTTRRFAGTESASDRAPFFGVSNGVIALPVTLREFYFAATGNGYILDDGLCKVEEAISQKSASALMCVIEPEKRQDDDNWPRTPPAPGATGPTHPPVWRCSSANGLVTAARSRPVHLMMPSLRVSPDAVAIQPPAANAPAANAPAANAPAANAPAVNAPAANVPAANAPAANPPAPYRCAGSWTLAADPDNAVDAVTVTLIAGGSRTELSATAADGGWSVHTVLKEPGATTVEVMVRYHNGFINVRKLATFDVEAEDTHSQVRVQPELMSSHMFRAVTLGVAITPVSKSFFRSGPWGDGCAAHLCVLDGISPSAVIRFSGDNSSVVQFGVAASLFFTQSVLVNAGILFGSPEPSQYWSPRPNFFLGFAIDPVLLTEARESRR